MGVREWVESALYVERNEDCAELLKCRMRSGHLAPGPVVALVEAVAAKDVPSGKPISMIMGGFPCQDISAAGKQAGVRGGATRPADWDGKYL